jgi:peroxiredoxin
VEPVVVLPQKREAVEQFVAERQLPFEILVDESREVVKAYGVWHRIGLDAWNISRPAIFLIDRDRSIRYSFIGKSQTEFPSHEEILHAIGSAWRPRPS